MSRRLVLPFGLLALAPAVLAQSPAGEIQEIVVNADFRGSGINAISSSISVIDQQLMQQKNAQHLEDILIDAPNVNLASGASRARFIQIRGIGERGQFIEPINPSVGVIIDGVDFTGIGNSGLLYDIEQVEVLLGPQGTRYGSNALAGLINLQSKAPTETASFGLQAEAANHNSNGLAGYASGPLNASKTLRYRVSAQNIRSDGFSHNDFLDRPTNKRDETSIRGKLQWLAADDITLDMTIAYLDMDNGYDVFSLDNVRNTLSDEPGFDRQRSELYSSKLTVERFTGFTMEAIAGYADARLNYGYDEDWVYEGFHPWGYSSTDVYNRDRLTRSGELRFISDEAGALLNGRTSWVAGLYSLRQDDDLTREYTFAPEDFNSSYRLERHAAFADTETQLNERWILEAGLRAERFSASYRDSSQSRFTPNDDLFGGKLAINYLTEAGNRLYASLSRGYKVGGFNADGSLDADLREFDPEAVWNYEIGFKGLLWERVVTRAALFYMDRDDVQISSSIVRMREDGSSEFIEFTGNAAGGRNYGMELSLDWQATDMLRLYGNLGLLETSYRNFTNSNGEDLTGREQAHAPNYQYTVGSSLDFTPNWRFDIHVQGRDAFYFSDSHDTRSPAYDLVNASLTYKRDNWRATLWGRNLGNQDFFLRGYFFGNDPRDGYSARPFTQLGEPRRYGLTLNMDF